MRNPLPPLKLSPEEEAFLRRWIYDEAHFLEGLGPAKRLQLEHRVPPADLALLAAVGFPDLPEQLAIAEGPPPGQPTAWPWSEGTLRERLREAKARPGLVTEPDR